MAVISKGIKLSYKGTGAEFVELSDLQEIPELGGEKEAIEITTLADAAHVYTDGLINYGDNLVFKFLYKKEQFTTLHGLEGEQEWKVTLPDSATFTFKGGCSVKLDGAGIAAALTYSLSIKPSSAITVA